jgi:hypothetical protein
MRFFAPLISVDYTSWQLDAKEDSEGLKPLECSSVMCVTESPKDRSDLNSKMATSQETWKCRGFLLAGFDRCGAASRDRAAHHCPKLSLNSIAKPARAFYPQAAR